MGNSCSVQNMRGKTKGKKKTNQTKDKDSDLEKSGENSSLEQKKPSVSEEEGHVEQTTREETVGCRREEASCTVERAGPSQQCTTAGVNTNSPSDHLSATFEEEAKWVDSKRADLIQTVSSAKCIADQMRQEGMIHGETYNQICTLATTQDQMRELLRVLTTNRLKSAFYRSLRETEPESFEDALKNVIKKNKEYLRKKCTWEYEGSEKARKEMKSLDQIYTELHIVRGESELVNKQHEIWELEDKFRNQTAEGITINCNDIFKSTPEDYTTPETDGREVRAIRTVMTKGIAGIGKTVSVKKFILDWADGIANLDLDFIFMFPFRELNLVKDKDLSLEKLVKEFHPELKNITVAKIFVNHKVLFIFDGLDESQFELNFRTTQLLTDPTETSSADTLVTNLIREHLVPSALVWITSRPGAVQRIPKQYICQWTEVGGFDDPQKSQYFKNRVKDPKIAEKIINHITISRSLYIMCHIPIFCWIASKVLEHLLLRKENSPQETIKTPTTLIEMYTHFFCIQMEVATDKYGSKSYSDTAEILKSNEEFIFKLSRMAFEKLEKGEIIFSSDDLKKYDISIDTAGVYCGLCTAIFKEESVFNSKRLYCFVHLTIQEYFAALFVYKSFASKRIDSPNLKDFLLIGSEEELKAKLEEHPVDLPLDELMEIAIANSALRKTGELDMFLRFLIGMSLKSTQELLQGLIQQTEDHSEVVEEIRKSLTDIDLLDCSADRCLNLIHCLAELKDSTLYDTVRQFVNSNQAPETQLSPVQCSALADLILMSKTPLEEFNPKKYRPTVKGLFRLLPAVRNSRKLRISGVDLDPWIGETISSALWMPRSLLTELHLTLSAFYEKGSKLLVDGLENSHCKLEALSLSGYGLSGEMQKSFASAIESLIPNLKELELSDNIVKCSLLSVISAGLRCPGLKTLRLNRNLQITEVCNEIATAFTAHSTNLQELELSYNTLKDSDMEILSAALTSTKCSLKALSLSHNKLSAKGCATLASALISRHPPLRELDLSWNDLLDAGVMELCNVLENPFCPLETLRLSFCKVTFDGCSRLVRALASDHCSLKELNLSFNHLTEEGAQMLMEKREDSRCSLQSLNVDQNEECWVNLKLLRQYACKLTLNPNTAGVNVALSKDNKVATYVHEKQLYPDHPERFEGPQVLCEEGLTSRHYWEVDCVNVDEVGVAYRSIPRQGDCSTEYSFGKNEKSWCWDREGKFYHNNSCHSFLASQTNNIGVYLDWPEGILCFFDVSSDSLTHLYTVCTTFTEPLHPGFGVR
ncbi:NLR family CARD domain-containing protein 3 isoform X2 [Nothobranchius furzeri]|uniref:Protein NLRC3-like n=3 Tax=Nothobranchius furzeri TaxID=105023 RepID=A0A9D3B9T7_NOTFU|nr:protein NLRC3-like [Nothobranchius furzeri]